MVAPWAEEEGLPKAKPQAQLWGVPVLPPKEFELDAFLFKRFFARMEKFGYAQERNGEKRIHAAVFRRMLRRFTDVVDPHLAYDVTAFRDGRGSAWLGWGDVFGALRDGVVLRVKLYSAERLSLLLEEPSCCVLGRIWAVLNILVILMSVVLIIVQSLPDICTTSNCFSHEATFVSIFFSVEYIIKLTCSPYCRPCLTDRIAHLAVAVPDPSVEVSEPLNYTRVQRLMLFLTRPLNIVDFLAVLPFWLDLLVGPIIPIPLVFLRALRLLRFFRLMKFGKFSSMLLVLGATMNRSTQAIYVLMLYVMITSLVVGAMLQQLEAENEPFRTVPSATWWVFTRMIGFQGSAPHAGGVPLTVIGTVIMSCVAAFKAILWILPFGQIGSNFREAWQENEDMTNMQNEVKQALLQTPETEWIEAAETPAFRVDLLDNEESVVSAAGGLPVPVMVEEWRPNRVAELLVPLHGAAMHNPFCSYAHPVLEFQVMWEPSAASNAILV